MLTLAPAWRRLTLRVHRDLRAIEVAPVRRGLHRPIPGTATRRCNQAPGSRTFFVSTKQAYRGAQGGLRPRHRGSPTQRSRLMDAQRSRWSASAGRIGVATLTIVLMIGLDDVGLRGVRGKAGQSDATARRHDARTSPAMAAGAMAARLGTAAGPRREYAGRRRRRPGHSSPPGQASNPGHGGGGGGGGTREAWPRQQAWPRLSDP